jgi:chromosome segregation ATPase
MRVLSALILVSFLTGCKSDEATKTGPTPPKAQISSSRSKEIAGLLNKKHQLSKKLKTLVATDKLDPTGDLKIIITEQQQAYRDLQNIRNTHPSLQKLSKDLAFWQQNQFSARTRKRDFEIKQSSDKIIEISTKIERLSQELPEIREAQDRITRSQKQIEELQGSLAEKSSEGQAILKELKIIEDQIKSTD